MKTEKTINKPSLRLEEIMKKSVKSLETLALSYHADWYRRVLLGRLPNHAKIIKAALLELEQHYKKKLKSQLERKA